MPILLARHEHLVHVNVWWPSPRYRSTCAVCRDSELWRIWKTKSMMSKQTDNNQTNKRNLALLVLILNENEMFFMKWNNRICCLWLCLHATEIIQILKVNATKSNNLLTFDISSVFSHDFRQFSCLFDKKILRKRQVCRFFLFPQTKPSVTEAQMHTKTTISMWPAVID